MARRVAVIVSQGQSQNPAKRNLEEDIVTQLMFEPGIDVTVIPHLYDLSPDSTGMLALEGVRGDMIVLSWLFERAAHWTLDRNGIHGRIGTVLLASESDEDDEEAAEDEEEKSDEPVVEKTRVINGRALPDRRIYCLDLRTHAKADPYVGEVKRIVSEINTPVMQLGGLLTPAPARPAPTPTTSPPTTPSPEAIARFQQPTNSTALPLSSEFPFVFGNGEAKLANGIGVGNGNSAEGATLTRINDDGNRRWYPVIDYSRCTNCMECIDFCLFGVYGVDKAETILVEQPDNCRKGCPACSRVCPENAIIFPQHKSPAIAGSMEIAGALKIDLSRLFGAPESSEDALAVAIRERDEKLLEAGRDAVGAAVGIPKRQAEKSTAPKDDLDRLIDSLDELDV
jgi:NAD-dependent dihydropyrimidine dehydrogenase PreA subunit